MFRRFHEKPRNFQSYENMLPLRCRLLYDWRDLNLKDVKDPIGIGHGLFIKSREFHRESP